MTHITVPPEGWTRHSWQLGGVKVQNRGEGGEWHDECWIEVAFDQGTEKGFLVEYFPTCNEVHLYQGSHRALDSRDREAARVLAVVIAKAVVEAPKYQNLDDNRNL